MTSLSVPVPCRYLASNNLVGTLPSSLGSLTRLTALNLASNSLSGTVPASVAALALPCEGMNTNVGVGNLLSGCMLNVSGNHNIVQGRNVVVQGDRNYVNGTHEAVTGSRNFVVDSASSDTARLGSSAVQWQSAGSAPRALTSCLLRSSGIKTLCSATPTATRCRATWTW